MLNQCHNDKVHFLISMTFLHDLYLFTDTWSLDLYGYAVFRLLHKKNMFFFLEPCTQWIHFFRTAKTIIVCLCCPPYTEAMTVGLSHISLQVGNCHMWTSLSSRSWEKHMFTKTFFFLILMIVWMTSEILLIGRPKTKTTCLLGVLFGKLKLFLHSFYTQYPSNKRPHLNQFWTGFY